jgi:hypothetical protein
MPAKKSSTELPAENQEDLNEAAKEDTQPGDAGTDAAHEPSPWKVLSRIDVSEQIEKKNGLSYLSWAWAWGVLREHYPNCYFIKHSNKDGIPYFIDQFGFAFVKVTVGLDASRPAGWEGQEVTETFPVLDHRNKPIQGPDAFSVNNALQRCLTKCIGYLGLGHYIYAGEDLPFDPSPYPGEDGDPQKNHGTNASGSQEIHTLRNLPNRVPDSLSPQGMTQPAPHAEEHGFPLVKPDGSQDLHGSGETLARSIEALLPLCLTVDDLTRFWTQNATARSVLTTRSPHLMQSVTAAFARRKAEITTAS